jgi:hypothetical protein
MAESCLAIFNSMIQEKNLRLAIKRMHQEKSEVVANCDYLSNLMENK